MKVKCPEKLKIQIIRILRERVKTTDKEYIDTLNEYSFELIRRDRRNEIILMVHVLDNKIRDLIKDFIEMSNKEFYDLLLTSCYGNSFANIIIRDIIVLRKLKRLLKADKEITKRM